MIAFKSKELFFSDRLLTSSGGSKLPGEEESGPAQKSAPSPREAKVKTSPNLKPISNARKLAIEPTNYSEGGKKKNTSELNSFSKTFLISDL